MKQTHQHGGKREGSGRPKKSLSVIQVEDLLKCILEREKLAGTTINDVLLDFALAEDRSGTHIKIGIRDRATSIKMLKDLTAPKITEGGETDKALGPSIYLPEQKPKLEVVTDIQKAKKEKEG